MDPPTESLDAADFIHGPAASGKLTVARRVGELTGFPVFHNHLVVDMLQAVFEFGSSPFVQLRESVWLRVFEQASVERIPGLIFTFTPEMTVRPDFVSAVVFAIENAGGRVLFVRLVCPEDELEKRMKNEARAEFGKLRSLDLYRRLQDEDAFAYPPLPDSGLTIDTSETEPVESARRIVDHFSLSSIR